ncbi:MAG TPA: hypothetical protein VH300_02020 [Thermoleophilaceae bacterium]|nr:hypothetical protein [Thermoleophilaceae bacterium]
MTVGLLALVSASPTAAAPATVSGLRWFIEVKPQLVSHLQRDCLDATGLAWSYNQPYKWGTDPYYDKATGSWDPTASRGSAVGKSKAVLFDSFTQVQQHTGHAWEIDDVGLEQQGGRVDITARIHSAASQFSAARRQRIAVIAHPHFYAGAGHSFSRRGKDLGVLPNSFAMGMTGSAKIAPAFVAATRRWRCKGRFANFERGHVRPGEALGKVTVGMGVNTATGLGGTVNLGRAQFTAGDNDDPVVVSPRSPKFDIPSGTHVPLACELGASCAPIGGGFALPGGFTLSYGGRTTTVADLAVSWDTAGGVRRTQLTGTVDGRPLTIAAGAGKYADVTDEFLAQVGTALGTDVRGGIEMVDPQFTATGPP